MRKETVNFRMDITFWLAVLLLVATMLSRHIGGMQPVNFNLTPSSGHTSGAEK